MTTTLQPSGRRTGATWVAATGAFLLLAGAGVFVAVQWDRLSETAKLGLVGALTAAFLVGGRLLRRTLPATGDVLFHLGAFLLPVDLAGIGLRTGMGWRTLLVAEGLLGIMALGGLAMLTGSVVLTWAATASVAVLAAGIASLSPVPAPLLLASVALAAELSGHHRLRGSTWTWAAAAGMAPVLGAAVTGVLGIGEGTMADLGLAGAALGSALSGSLAALVLARRARGHEDLRLAFLALASFGVGLVHAWAGAALPASATALGLAAVFVLVEVAALLAARDPFWRQPLATLAELAEVAALVAAMVAGAVLLAAPFADRLGPEPVWATASALLAVGLLTADIRRYRGTPRPFGLSLLRGSGWPVATVPVAVAAVVAVEIGTASAPATAIALLAAAVLAMLSGRPWSEAVAAGFAPWAVAAASGRPAMAAVAGLAGAAVVAETAVRRARRLGASAVDPLLAAVAAATVLAALAVAEPVLGPAGAVAAAVPACWLLAVQLERAGSRRPADVARLALLTPVVAALSLPPAQAVPVLVAAAVLYAADAVRLGRPEVAIGTAVAVQGVVLQVALGAGITGPALGLALCVAAVAWAGLALVVEDEWRLPFLAAAGSGLALGLAGASGDPSTFANALLVTGGLVVGAGIASRRADIGHAGGVLCTLAIALHLLTAGVEEAEPYFAPVSAQLLLAGWSTRRRGRPAISSWTAYVPGVALLGGVALIERISGGAGWHALVAGAVGTASVAVGGWRRLAGPMLAGTALLVTVTLYESLAALAGVPTWGWLSLGGTVLLTLGIALERSDTSPMEAGRRIVDVVAERFG